MYCSLVISKYEANAARVRKCQIEMGTRGKGKRVAGFASSGSGVQFWVALTDAWEEAVPAENGGVMDCEQEIFTVCDAVQNRIAEAERKAEVALVEAEMAAAEAESAEMEVDMLLKDLGLRD